MSKKRQSYQEWKDYFKIKIEKSLSAEKYYLKLMFRRIDYLATRVAEEDSSNPRLYFRRELSAFVWAVNKILESTNNAYTKDKTKINIWY